MSGKSYTMREMKIIVEYLVENSAYSEFKGRKMWMDFANTQLTTRTWQSLKETFLKRILPDISNPYYKLNIEQINSFKRGLDLTHKDKNKLEFTTVEEELKEVKGDNGQPSTSKCNDGENGTGEDTTCSKIVHNRASTETLVLGNCYESAQDIQKELENTDEEQANDKTNSESKSGAKSVRDFIVYSEPLTPMLQEVLDDFDTDVSSDRDPPMEIDETYMAQEKSLGSPEVQSQSILNRRATASDVAVETTSDCNGELAEKTNNNIENQQVTEIQDENVKRNEENIHSQLEDVMVWVDKALASNVECELNTKTVESQEMVKNSNESSSAMTDSLLPNNQEAITVKSPVISTPVKEEASIKRKHANSVEKNGTSNNIHMDTDQSPVTTGAINEKKDDEKPSNSVDESQRIESPKRKRNLTLNISKDSNIQSEPMKSNEEKISSHDEVTPIRNHNSDDSDNNNNPSSSQVDNPCLKSVSLYAEQFSSAKYSDSDLNDKEGENEPKKDEIQEEKSVNANADAETEVILLKSDTATESDCVIKRNALAQSSAENQKKKNIASIFGFNYGGAKKRSRLSGRRRTVSHRKGYKTSESSEWISASDSEVVSPPRGRRNKYSGKYMKPQSMRVMSLDEDGGLFVIIGKKIYPLVKDGKIAKNYLSYMSESDPEDEDFWKTKYVEEKKRTAKLLKAIEQSKLKVATENGANTSETKTSPTETTPRILNSRPSSSEKSVKNGCNGNEVMNLRESTSVDSVKIKISKFDQEVQLEGHWQHINPMLAQLVSMLKEPGSASKPSLENVPCVELSSGNTTPSVMAPDPGVQDKIDKLESDIFKEIEQKHEIDKEDDQAGEQGAKEEEPKEAEPKEEEPKVTIRKKRGRPKQEDMPQSHAKKIKELIKPEVKQLALKDSTPNIVTEKRIRTPRKLLGEETIPAQRKNTRKSSATKVTENIIEDEEVLYRFPSPLPEKRGRKSKTIISNNANEPAMNLNPITSPDSSHHSVTSSQGYQDSDASPFHIGLRKKRKLSVSAVKGRTLQRKYRSKSYPLITHCESSNSSFNISVNAVTRESTVNSEVYRTESYQLFMPRTKTIIQKLAKINETTVRDSDLHVTIRKRNNTNEETNGQATKSDVASSSNLSLPASPELSIVEDLSISKSALAAIKAFPTINETQINTAMNMFDKKYLMSQVDVSMPLMAQECGLKESYQKHLMSALNTLSELRDVPNSAGRNLPTLDSSALKVSSFSEKILREFGASNVEGSPSDSLDRRLEQLLLESVKKPCHIQSQDKMEVDTQVKKRKGSWRRCSTPNKKTSIQKKSKVPTVGPLVEEQSKARHARTGRRSCPPSINIVYYENNAPDNLQINIHDQKVDVTAVTKRKSIKKDVIKVKILRPKDKPQQKRTSRNTEVQNVTRTTRNVKCGNESGVFLQGFDESADLIHNHSETCLHVKDCLENSIEIIETESRSIICLNSSSSNGDGKDFFKVNMKNDGKETPELFCDNAQFALNFCDARSTVVRSPESGNTPYFTPVMSQANSLLTEDLSEEEAFRPQSRASKWYLVSEEETNYDTIPDSNTRIPSFMSNLKQLFPIACAIPDLSTISEKSERNDDHKLNLDDQDATDLNSQRF